MKVKLLYNVKNYSEKHSDEGLQMLLRWGLYLLIGASELYRLQLYVSFPFSASSRFLLYSILLIGIILTRRALYSLPLLYWGLGFAVVATGIHTFFLYNFDLAVHSSARFSNVMLIAPFASLLFVNDKDLMPVFRILLVVFLVSFASVLYQYWGGRLDRLVGDYIAIRGDLIRHMSIVGEPNVGGMLAVIAFVIGISVLPRRGWSIFFSGLAIAFVVLSISKAALIGLVVVSVLLYIIAEKGKGREFLKRSAYAYLFGAFFIMAIGADDYFMVSAKSVWGGLRGEPSVFESIQARQGELSNLNQPRGELSNLNQPLVFSLLFGRSYGVAGSAAQEILGTDAGVVLPHNSYMELFLTGGLTLLVLVVSLMLRAFQRLLPVVLRESGSVSELCALVCLIVLTFWMFVFPVIYEPITGSLFWTVVGYGNRVQRCDA